jgi:hypothetical protein
VLEPPELLLEELELLLEELDELDELVELPEDEELVELPGGTGMVEGNGLLEPHPAISVATSNVPTSGATGYFCRPRG